MTLSQLQGGRMVHVWAGRDAVRQVLSRPDYLVMSLVNLNFAKRF